MIYSWRYPKSIHRSVMIGVNPPGHFLWDAKTTGEQIRRYAALCAQDESCRSRTPDLAASIHSAFGNIPERWLFLPIKEGNVKAAAFFGLMAATTDGAGPLAAPWTIDTLLSAQQGDGGGAWFLSLMAQMAFPSEQFWGDVAAVARTDAATAAASSRTAPTRGRSSAAPAPTSIWAGGRLLDAWPATPDENMYGQVRDSNVETLLIGGDLDFATPPQWASRDLLPHLPNGHEVVLETSATRRLLDLPARGRHAADQHVPRERPGRHSLYKPTSSTSRRRSATARSRRSSLGVMLGLAALTVLSLLWMARRVHRRGGYGRKASATLRSVYPIVLGLGGWFLGVLIVLDDDARRRPRRRLLARALGRRAGRPRDLPGLGEPRLVRAGPRPRDSRRRQQAPSSVRGSGSTRQPTVASSPRSLGAAVARTCPHRPRHRLGSAGSRSLRRNRSPRDPGSAPRLITTRPGQAGRGRRPAANRQRLDPLADPLS